MATNSPFRQAVGQYGANSIAGRGPVQLPSSKRRGTSASDGIGYMQAAQGGAPTGGRTRADNIAAARADGTFDAKRNAFNAANKGSYMDSTGTIGPKAEMPTTSTPAAPAPMSPASPAPAPAPTMTQPKGPATFENKPKATFFGAAMAKYGPTAGVPVFYNDQETKAVAANGGKPLPTPKPMPAPAAPKASFTAAATSKPYAGPMARPADPKPKKQAGFMAAATMK